MADRHNAVLYIRAPAQLHDRLKRAARAEDLTVSQLVRRILSEWETTHAHPRNQPNR